MKAVKFDWLDSSTFEAPLEQREKITVIYLIAPEGLDPTAPMTSFIDVAMKHGVKKFVVLTGSKAEYGSNENVGCCGSI